MLEWLFILTLLFLILLWFLALRQATADRRVEPRIPVRVPVRLVQPHRQLNGVMLDAGQQGFQIAAWSFTPLGGQVQVYVPHGDREALFEGNIVWWKPERNLYRYGIALNTQAGYELERITLERLLGIFQQDALEAPEDTLTAPKGARIAPVTQPESEPTQPPAETTPGTAAEADGAATAAPDTGSEPPKPDPGA